MAQPNAPDVTEPAPGELHWGETTAEFAPGVAVYRQPLQQAQFRFVNPGKTAVEILSLDADCSCTRAVPSARILKPGEEGRIDLFVQTKGYYGRLQATVDVRTREIRDDAGAPPAETHKLLKVIVQIPEPVTAQPTELVWRVGEPAEAKTVAVSAAVPDKLLIAALTPGGEDPSFQTEVRTTKDGLEFEISIRPVNTDRAVVAEIPIECGFVTGAGREIAGPAGRWNFLLRASVTESSETAE